MRYTQLGHTDLTVSVVGLGCNNFGRRADLSQTRAVVDAALDAGITFFDTAESYGDGNSERFLGELLRGRRERVVLATKFAYRDQDGVSAGYVRRAVDASLARLDTDWLDLYYYHWPDPGTPIAETLDALDELVRAGKVRHIGCSNFDAAQLREADTVADSANLTRFTVLQNEYNLLNRDVEADVLPACLELGIGFVPYFPLANGLLTGKYRRGEAPPADSRLEARLDEFDDAAFDRLTAFEQFAGTRGRSLLELAIAGLDSEPGVSSVIAGAMRPEQVQANAAAADWTLDDAEREAVRGLG
jgi:aryl-alcohol dehydrogenase-like predicted oxidoreductase